MQIRRRAATIPRVTSNCGDHWGRTPFRKLNALAVDHSDELPMDWLAK